LLEKKKCNPPSSLNKTSFCYLCQDELKKMESDCRGKEADKGENLVSTGSVWNTQGKTEIQVISELVYHYSWSE
jgi:hypothetical protein